MLKQIRKARETESGFTLIELLIVIVILGVLAGIVVFAVSAFNNDGKDVACKADKKNVEIALEAYFAKVGSRPASAVYGPLTAAGTQYLKEAPSTKSYHFHWDTNGAVSAFTGATGNTAYTNC